MLKNVFENSMKRRNDFCYLLGEIFENCSIDKNELSNEMITGTARVYSYYSVKSMKINLKYVRFFKDIVMLCVWPEIIEISHWLDCVRFKSINENFILKKIMLDIMYKVFVNLSRKIEVIL